MVHLSGEEKSIKQGINQGIAQRERREATYLPTHHGTTLYTRVYASLPLFVGEPPAVPLASMLGTVPACTPSGLPDVQV